jgi:DNA-binding transcriptional LysR family regulator
MTGQPIEVWKFRRGNKALAVKIVGRLTVVEFGSMLGACLGGFGIARVKRIGVERLIQQGALVEVLTDWRGESFPLYALYPSRHLPAAKVRAFVDFVQSRITPVDRVGNQATVDRARVKSTASSRSARGMTSGPHLT